MQTENQTTEKKMSFSELTNLFTSASPVMIVENPNEEGKPLVTVMRDKITGAPKTDLNGNILGSIRVEQQISTLSGTFLNSRNRVAFIGGVFDHLVEVARQHNLKHGSLLPGKICIKESLEPMWKGHNPKINPQTSEVIAVSVGDKAFPVYMQMFYTEDEKSIDKLIRSADDVNTWMTNRKALETNTNEVSKETPVRAVENANIPVG
jgi:hypothetical protein